MTRDAHAERDDRIRARQAELLAEHGTSAAAAAALAARGGNTGEAGTAALAGILMGEGWGRRAVSYQGGLSEDWYWHPERTVRDGLVNQVRSGRHAKGTGTGLISAFSRDDRTTALKSIRAADRADALDTVIEGGTGFPQAERAEPSAAALRQSRPRAANRAGARRQDPGRSGRRHFR